MSLAQPALADTAAPGQLQAEITSPAASASVTGQVPVTVHLTGDGSTTPTRATVTIASVATPAESRSASVDNLDPSCATACDVVVTVDTMSWQDPGDDPNAVPTMLDNGQATIDASVTADSASGPVTASAPQLSVYATGRAPLNWTANWWETNQRVYQDTGTARFSMVQPPAAQDHLVMTIFGNGYHRDLTAPAQVDPNDSAFTEFAAPIDMTGQPDGMYWMRAASIDVTGRASAVQLVPVSVYSGPAITQVTSLLPTTCSTSACDGREAQLNLKVTLGPGGFPYSLSSFDVSIDGSPVDRVTDFTYDAATGAVSMPVNAPGGSGASLPAGAHTVSVAYNEVVNNDGYNKNPTIATANWTGQLTSAGVATTTTVLGPVVQGSSGSLRVAMTGVDHDGLYPTVASWNVFDVDASGNGPDIGGGTCTASCANLTVNVPLSTLVGGYPGVAGGTRDHTLAVQVIDSMGVWRFTYLHVLVDPKVTVSMTAPSTAGYLSSIRVSATVRQATGQLLPGVPVTFQAMTGGSNLWRNVGTATTNSSGGASAPITMAYNTKWRAVVAQRVGYNGAGASTTPSTAVPARAVLTGVPSSGYAYHGYTMATTVSPHSYGRLVYVLARKYGTTTWVTIAKPLTDSFGVARNTLKLARGTWYIRTVASGTLASATGYSATVTTVMR